MDTTRQIPSSKALGTNSFTSFFYKFYRDLIKVDLLTAIDSFFTHGKLLKELSHTNIALVPKANSPKWFVQNYCKKHANRLNIFLPNLISPYQIPFVSVILIQENTILTQEVFHHLKRGRGGRRKVLWR